MPESEFLDEEGTDIPLPLSQEFDNQIEDLDLQEPGGPVVDDDDTDAEGFAVEAEYEHEIRAKVAEPIPPDAIDAEPVIDGFSEFLRELPRTEVTTINVIRMADRNLSGQFRLPCDTTSHIDSLYWEYPTTAEEIYRDVARTHGGGKYQFQIKQGKGFPKGKTWSAVIHDPAEPSRAERTLLEQKAKEKEQERIPEPSQTYAAPKEIDAEEMLEKELNRMEKFMSLLERLRGPQVAPAEPGFSVKDTILLKAIERSTDPELNQQILKKAFSVVTEEKKSWADTGYWLLTHGDEIANTFGSVFKTFAPIVAPLLGNWFKPTVSVNLPGQPPFTVPLQQAGTQPGSAQAPAAASGFNMPDKPADAVPPAPVAETPPAGPQPSVKPLKKVEW